MHKQLHPLLFKSATDMAAMLRTKKGQPLSKRDFADLLVSSVRSIELVNLYIAQIEAVNPSLNAVVQTRFATARKEAMHCDEVLRTWNVRVKPPESSSAAALHCRARRICRSFSACPAQSRSASTSLATRTLLGCCLAPM